MKYFIPLPLILILLWSCEPEKQPSEQMVEEDSVSIPAPANPDLIFQDTTLYLMEDSFRIIAGRRRTETVDDYYALVIKLPADTQTVHDVTAGVEIEDVDLDSYPDLIVQRVGNNPWYQLFLFDPLTRGYREVRNYPPVSYSNPLAGKRGAYYVYRRAGCGDLNWTSTLFRIHNFQVQVMGFMTADGCRDFEELNGIIIYRPNYEGKLIQVDQLPIDTLESYPGSKWEFIEHYWQTNYSRFQHAPNTVSTTN